MSVLRVLCLVCVLLPAASPSPAQAQTDQIDQDQSGQTQPGATDSNRPATEGEDTAREEDGGKDQEGAREPDQEPERKRYLVEVIAFQYLGPDTSAGEEFDQLLVEEYLPSEPFDLEAYQTRKAALTYTDMEHLSDALEKLRLNERYRVMTHLAWTQPLLNKNEAVEVPLGPESRRGASSVHAASRAPAASRISGSMRVYGDYLLFVDLDLSIALPARSEDAPLAKTTANGSTAIPGGASFPEPEDAGEFEIFHISEKRRIKLEEFHYFDHPYFGAIVSVVRDEEDE